MRIETQRFIDLYVERTGTDADTIARVMSEDRVMDADEALSLGIVGVINTPNTALSNPINKIMSKKKCNCSTFRASKGIAKWRSCRVATDNHWRCRVGC